MTSRLNWGCGESPAAGWTNSDRIAAPEIDARCDIRDGLPYADESFDYAVAIHALQDLGWADIPHALEELRRVLRVGLSEITRRHYPAMTALAGFNSPV